MRAAAECFYDAGDVVVLCTDIYVAARTTAVAGAAEAHVDLWAAVRCAEQRAGDAEATRAAATADALRRDRVRLFALSEDIGGAAHRHVAGCTADVARAADAEIHVRRPADAARDAEAAVTAATADAL